MVEATTPARRRHASGAATRVLLLEAAERLFAIRGIDGVTLREIQVAAGQSNSSVITYHFGSKTGLVRALVAHRQSVLDAELHHGATQLERVVAERASGIATARELVGLVVGPLVSSIRRGEMYVPFLARLSEDPLARSEYWPPHIDDRMYSAETEQLVGVLLSGLPERVRRARNHQFFTSMLHVLGDHARNGTDLSPARVSSYVDGWAALLVAKVSPETTALLEG
jgi:AcrR family transcriptional regulator